MSEHTGMEEPPAAVRVASDKDALMSTPLGDSQHTLVTANSYADSPRTDWNGALIEETSAFRSNIELFYDLHTLFWDPSLGETLNVRNDATGTVSWTSSKVPELRVENEFRFGDGTEASLDQRVVASVDRCGLLVHNKASFADNRERTIFTLSRLAINEHSHDDPYANHEATVYHKDDCDVIVATDGDRYVAFAQQRGENRRFDGHRVGLAGKRHGPNRSAWSDIYEEGDGWIDSTDSASGSVDLGFGLHCDPDADTGGSEIEWLTAVGFGKKEQAAIDHARETLDAGYEAERTAFAEAWETWHADVTTAPTDDAASADLYQRSLTSIKVGQDGCCATIAGAFKPHDMTYKFIWPRDQVIIVQALLAAGATDEAALAVNWLDGVQITEETVDERGIDRRGTLWQNYYTTGESHWRALQLDQVGGPIYRRRTSTEWCFRTDVHHRRD